MILTTKVVPKESLFHNHNGACRFVPNSRIETIIRPLVSLSSDTSFHFVEFPNVHNGDRSSNPTQSSLPFQPFCRIAERRITRAIE